MTRTASAPTKGPAAAREHAAADPDNDRMIEDLRELITALNRRVPRLERTGEIEIARDASALRDKALERIAELERSGS